MQLAWTLDSKDVVHHHPILDAPVYQFQNWLMLLFQCVHAIHLDVMHLMTVHIARLNAMIVEMMINVRMKKIMDNSRLALLDQCVIMSQDVSFVMK